MKVLNIINIGENNSISIGIKVPSNKMREKDVIKIENRFLEKIELDKIAMIAPNASISIIKNYDIIEKFSVDLPQKIIGILKCNNQNCITNAGEPVNSEFNLVSSNPLTVKCVYCKREMADNEIINNL